MIDQTCRMKPIHCGTYHKRSSPTGCDGILDLSGVGGYDGSRA